MLKKIFFKLLGERKKDYIRVILSGIFCISVVFFSTSVGSSLVYISTGRRATMTELVMEVEKNFILPYVLLIFLMILIILGYIRKRSSDYAMLNILGIKKKHRYMYIGCEYLGIILGSIAGGLILGILEAMIVKKILENIFQNYVSNIYLGISPLILTLIISVIMFGIGFAFCDQYIACIGIDHIVSGGSNHNRASKNTLLFCLIGVAVFILTLVSIVTYWGQIGYTIPTALGIITAVIFTLFGCRLYLEKLRKQKNKYYKKILWLDNWYDQFFSHANISYIVSAFLIVILFGFNIVLVDNLPVRQPENYPYDIVWGANIKDKAFIEKLKEKYNVQTEFIPSIRVTSGNCAEHTGISATEYKRLTGKQVHLKNDEIYVVYQWDRSEYGTIGLDFGKLKPRLYTGCATADIWIYTARTLPGNKFTRKYTIKGNDRRIITGNFKTRQLRHIITQEALFLCIIGIPVGLLLGYGIGAVLTPIALETTSIIGTKAAISSSPLIFIGSAVFAIITVFLSCRKPGKMAAKVSPVEAAKYTEGMTGKKKKRHSRGAKVYQMAFANLGRNKKKTILVVVSLTLSVTLLNVLFSLVNGFDMDKYVDRSTCADFIVSSTDYFRYNTADEYIGADTIDEIKENTDETVSGSGYDLADISPMMWMETDQYSKLAENYLSGKELQEEISHYEQKGDSILVDVSIEGFDDGLFDKLTVVKGSLEPLSDPDSHAIAVAVSTDDYGNIVNLDNYPELGDTYTVNYQIGYDIDSRTGERADQQTTPEEYLEYHEEEAKEVEYSVCALVTVPDSISFRYTSLGYSMVLPVEKLKEDSGTDVIPKFYMFDTPDSQAEASAEQYLQKLTAGDTSTLMYESKASIRREFTRFKNMFLICGGALCAIIGLVGILNFFNAIMTGILSRKREFAVLQSVGMTKRQLKLMLIYEGLFYAVGSIIASLILSVVLSPMLGNMMSAMFWFVTYHFTIMPVILIIPVFLLLGWLIPAVLYHAGKRQSIVENLREL